MVEDGSFWDKIHRFLCPDYVVACVQVKPSSSDPSCNIRDATKPIISGGSRRFPCFLERNYQAKMEISTRTRSFKRNLSVEIRVLHARNVVHDVNFESKVDRNRRACLDKETGLLVNHAYRLMDMKVTLSYEFKDRRKPRDRRRRNGVHAVSPFLQPLTKLLLVTTFQVTFMDHATGAKRVREDCDINMALVLEGK